ncbi:MAG TPA: S8 family serine peptidase, partial [Candidatus Ozemobacteraceae bacterium]|nr:S8 family serine peptidase [Candidatus Ozemobacteraceae bacterium]
MMYRSRFVVLAVALLVLVGMQAAFAAEVAGKFIVRFVPDPSAPQKGSSHKTIVSHLQQQLERNLADQGKLGGAKILNKLWIINGVEVAASPAQVATLKKNPRIASVTPVQYRKYIDFGKPVEVKAEPGQVQWSIAKVRAPEVWKEFNIDGSGVIVGHLDTGVAANHPSLKGKVLAFRDFTPANKPESYDDQGHGTHTAGSIAASDGIGVAPGARLIVAKVFDRQGSAEDAWLLGAMQWVMDPDGNAETNDGPALVSNSWGSDTTDDRTFWDIVKVWEAADIVPVFAAGNNGPSGKCGTPANFPHSWAVAATTNKDGIAYFSSVGPSVWDGVTLTKPDIAAPGYGVISCSTSGGLVSNMGTSMACPHVAGLAALMLQANPKLTIAEVRQIAEATAVDLALPARITSS